MPHLSARSAGWVKRLRRERPIQLMKKSITMSKIRDSGDFLRKKLPIQQLKIAQTMRLQLYNYASVDRKYGNVSLTLRGIWE